MEPIILASGSPRRQDFFRLLGIPFTCIPANIDETPPPGLSPRQVAEDLALRKIMAVTENLLENSHTKTQRHGEEEKSEGMRDFKVPRHSPSSLSPCPRVSVPPCDESRIKLIFGADTIVVLGDELFGKAADRDEARGMLSRLAGHRHEVITALALHNRETGKTDCRSVSSKVEFAPLSKADIEWYLDTGEWEGVAGAYRLQERGACLITSIHGSPSGIAGLPLYDFFDMLKNNGYRFGA
ncbi:MAG: Maf family protein [Treponema sp.]|nr:Maf family protein [Treponema sp.]